jgi:arylsulfatase
MNILLIMSDQEQHWSHVPAELARPGMDWLLERGVAFDQHHVVTVPCGPSRSTIYTGQHTQHTKVLTNPGIGGSGGMSSSTPTIGGMLREVGYYTAYKGKWHVSVIEPADRFSGSTVGALEEFGFAEYTNDGDPVGIPWDGYRQDPAIAADAANWLLGRSGDKPSDQPWLLTVNFVNPHDVMFFDATGNANDTVRGMRAPRLPAPYAPLYEKKWDLALPDSFTDDLRAKPKAQAYMAGIIDNMLGALPHEDEEAWRARRSYYYNCLVDLDQHVHTVLRALVESGHDRDTVVIYTSDHGEAGGAHGLREKLTSLYREIINVPLVIAHPDVAGGTRTSALSSAIDLAPTILSLADVDPQRCERDFAHLHGVDLSPVVVGDAPTSERDAVLFCMSHAIPASLDPSPDGVAARLFLRGIFDGRWKFARYFSANEHHRPVGWAELATRNDLELYDTHADPQELHNIAGDPAHRDKLVELSARLEKLIDAEVGSDDGQDLFELVSTGRLRMGGDPRPA